MAFQAAVVTHRVILAVVAVEAMACGVPVASLDMGAAREVIAEAGRIINQRAVQGHRYHDAIRPTIDTEEFEDA